MRAMQETRKNNPIDPNLEKKLVPQRGGDDHQTRNPNSPAGDKLTEDKNRKSYTDSKPERQKPN
ncbi:MAG: hypothetical protein UR98_C0018G0001 [Parcubacteria group bacterium GW2011_GWA1_36_12]|nr:MAG: hypothetical protein UR98_C0018G0001 [Parcubacteria group bacterium GW2011_GWA1_36_12]